jgi:hypothetical protein
MFLKKIQENKENVKKELIFYDVLLGVTVARKNHKHGF